MSGLSQYLSVAQGGKIKLKCKVAGSPSPDVTWLKDGRPIRNDIRISIKNKRYKDPKCFEHICCKKSHYFRCRKRSILRLNDAQGRDAGKYTCRATNVLGEHSQTTSISVRVLGTSTKSEKARKVLRNLFCLLSRNLSLLFIAAPDPPASACPIDSFCLNGGKCSYYELIGELVCR